MATHFSYNSNPRSDDEGQYSAFANFNSTDATACIAWGV